VKLVPRKSVEGPGDFITGGGTGLGPLHGYAICRSGCADVSRRPPRRAACAKHAKRSTVRVARRFYHLATCETMVRWRPRRQKPRSNSAKSTRSSTTPQEISWPGRKKLTPNAFQRRRRDRAQRNLSLHASFLGKRWISRKAGRKRTQYRDHLRRRQLRSGFVVPSACAKAGVLAMTTSLAVEWAKISHPAERHRAGTLSERKGACSSNGFDGIKRDNTPLPSEKGPGAMAFSRM